jgi:hypothetical protein
MTSQADACSYCMGSVVVIASQIYLYFSYFGNTYKQYFARTFKYLRPMGLPDFKSRCDQNLKSERKKCGN